MSATSVSGTYEPKTKLGRITNFVDSRVSGSMMVKEFGRKVFPDHWSFMFGEVALYSFVILLLSGTFLTFFFDPSMAETHYEGSYVPLKGVEMSVAYASSLDISFDVRGGLFMRQVHHWSALLFVASVSVHMLRVFFTGAFRKPRELNWVVGGVLLILALAAGFTGYSLPDDLLSGNGLRIIDGVIKAVPVVGTYISFFLFGGEFPGTAVIGRLYVLHILLVPALILLMIGIHLFMVSSTSTPSGAVRDVPTTTLSASRLDRSTQRRPVDSSSSSSASLPSSRQCSRSTRSGTTVRMTPPPCPQAPSLTGTSAGLTAPCA